MLATLLGYSAAAAVDANSGDGQAGTIGELTTLRAALLPQITTPGAESVTPWEGGGTRTPSAMRSTDLDSEERTKIEETLSNVDASVFASREIVAEGEGGTTVQFRLEVTDTSGTPISTASVGQEVHLDVYVRDLQATGVFAAFLDIAYEAGYVTASPITFGPTYQSFAAGSTALDGLIDEAGASDGFSPLGANEFFLFRVPFTAMFPGTVNFQGNPADQSPQHDVLRFGSVIPISPGEVDYGSAQLTIPLLRPIQICDDGDACFSTVETWGYLADPGSGYTGYQTDLHYSLKGNGTDVASWRFVVKPGLYEVSATWSTHPNRGQDAPYTILDNSSPLGTVDVNQEAPPNDFTDVVSWERLGTFMIISGTLVVELSDDISDPDFPQYVIADAIRIERL